MDFSTIIGAVLGGLACRIYAGAGALWMATEAVKPLTHVAEVIRHLP